jgi:hypothetical protein
MPMHDNYKNVLEKHHQWGEELCSIPTPRQNGQRYVN